MEKEILLRRKNGIGKHGGLHFWFVGGGIRICEAGMNVLFPEWRLYESLTLKTSTDRNLKFRFLVRPSKVHPSHSGISIRRGNRAIYQAGWPNECIKAALNLRSRSFELVA